MNLTPKLRRKPDFSNESTCFPFNINQLIVFSTDVPANLYEFHRGQNDLKLGLGAPNEKKFCSFDFSNEFDYSLIEFKSLAMVPVKSIKKNDFANDFCFFDYRKIEKTNQFPIFHLISNITNFPNI